jgi:DNA-binding response OmpR family regulator
MSVEIRILLIDYSKAAHELMQKEFEKEGYAFKSVRSSKSAVKTVQRWLPHLIFIGRTGTPAESISLIIQLRALAEDVLLVKLSDTSSVETEIQTFDAGADDYIHGSLRFRALFRRVTALLRRLPGRDTSTEITIGNLYMNMKQAVLKVDGKDVDIPKAGFNLLFFLAAHPDQVFSRKELLWWVWGEEVAIDQRAIDVHINSIRNLIGKNQIKTVKKSGYKFKPSSSAK